MKKAFPLFLFGVVLMAAASVPAPPAAYTTQDQIYYVATGGSDRNTCTSSNAPCQTVQGAINKIPKHVRNQITIQVASGTYYADEALTVLPDSVTGNKYHRGTVQLSGFTFEDNAGAADQKAWLHIECAQTQQLGGTYVVSGTYDGLATGTITAPPDAGWTVNGYAGMFVEYLAGANAHTTNSVLGNVNLSPIVSNTARVLTLTTGRGWAAVPDGGDQVRIVSNTVHIVGKKASTGNGATDVLAAVAFVGNNGGEANPYQGGNSQLEVRNCDLVIPDAGTSTVAIYAENSAGVVSGATSQAVVEQVDVEKGGSLSMWDSYLKTTGGGPQGVVINNQGRMSVFDSYISGPGAIGLNATGYLEASFNWLNSSSTTSVVTFDHSAGRLNSNVFTGATAVAGVRMIASKVNAVSNSGTVGTATSFGWKEVWQSQLAISGDTLTALIYSPDGGTAYPDGGHGAITTDNGTTSTNYADVTGATNKTIQTVSNTVSSY